MRNLMRGRFLYFIAIIFVLLSPTGWGLGIGSTGDWYLTIGSADLVSGPGSNLPSYFESASNLISIDITGAIDDNDNWRVDVKKTDGTWNIALHLNAYRTNDGSGTGSISGGTSYQEITSTDSQFFNGRGDRSDITVRLKMSGISVTLPPATYSTTVTFTVVDTL
jgi:hypothetical protein